MPYPPARPRPLPPWLADHPPLPACPGLPALEQNHPPGHQAGKPAVHSYRAAQGGRWVAAGRAVVRRDVPPNLIVYIALPYTFFGGPPKHQESYADLLEFLSIQP